MNFILENPYMVLPAAIKASTYSGEYGSIPVSGLLYEYTYFSLSLPPNTCFYELGPSALGSMAYILAHPTFCIVLVFHMTIF